MGSLRSAARRFACTRQRCQIDSRFVCARLLVTFSRVPNNESYSLLSPGSALGRAEVDKLFRCLYRESLCEPQLMLLFSDFFSIALLKFHLRHWAIHNTFSLKKDRARSTRKSFCMLNAVFTSESSSWWLSSQQPNMGENIETTSTGFKKLI